jgi:bifunctional DNA-binding transcriptional regulator/antitoxin component of YhaV-PrlF toxin-antitoxin module
MTKGSEMGEVTTITYARPDSKSLRVTVPQGVAKQFQLDEGDQLDWTIKAQDGKLIILVTPVPKKRK